MSCTSSKLFSDACPQRSWTQPPGTTGPDRELYFETSVGPARVYAAAAQLPMELHRRAFAGHAKDFGYYQIAAETLADQFQHRYLVLQNQRTGQAALQPVFLADQDILEGLPRQFSSVLAAPRQIRPRWLKLQMLVAGGSLYHFNTGFDYTVSL